MNVWFYRFSKRNNSTLEPSEENKQYSIDCILRQSTSILNPVIILDKTYNGVVMCNYVKIPQWNRYYFITDIVSSDDMWIVSLSLDVLASYRNDILSSNQYVLRASKIYNELLVDNMYPTRGGRSCIRTFVDTQNDVYRKPHKSNTWSVERNYFSLDYAIGGYIVGIVSNNSSGVTYYGFTRTDFVNFVSSILTLRPSDITDTSDGLKKILFDGLQYIVSVKWFPVLPGTISENYVSSISIGGYDISVPQQRVFDLKDRIIEDFYFTVSLPSHPEKNIDNKEYLAFSPYSEYNLYFQPFGDIPIDTTKFYIINDNRIKVMWSVDYATGHSNLKITDVDGSRIIYTTTSTIGVELPLSGVTIKSLTGLGVVMGANFIRNYLAPSVAQTSAILTTKPSHPKMHPISPDTFTNYNREVRLQENANNIAKEIEPITNVIDIGSDMLGSALGQCNTIGRPESFLPYTENPFVYGWFSYQSQTDVARFGRPLNAKETLSRLLPGFVKCADANIVGDPVIVMTMTERSLINDILNKGCYLE